MSENNFEGDQQERCMEAKFVDDKSAELIQRVTSVLPIADELRRKVMLHGEEYDEIKAKKTNQEKMRKLFESLNSGGNKVKIAFYNLLEKFQLHLFEDLGGVSRKRKLSDPETPVPCKRLNNESNELNNPHASASATRPAPINIVNNIVHERSPYQNINTISILNKMEQNPPAPKNVKTPAPKKEKKTAAPKKVKNTAAPKKVKNTAAPKKVKKTAAPKKVKNTAAPKKVKKTAAPKKVKKTAAPKKVKKTAAPKKVKNTAAPKKVKKTAAPKKVKKAAARK